MKATEIEAAVATICAAQFEGERASITALIEAQRICRAAITAATFC